MNSIEFLGCQILNESTWQMIDHLKKKKKKKKNLGKIYIFENFYFNHITLKKKEKE